ncbi:MAG TPA: hypothetical protein ENN09_00255 [Planctomycetes bacterium]|nr:hypothetical protein [Planctomycetota bacterium]
MDYGGTFSKWNRLNDPERNAMHTKRDRFKRACFMVPVVLVIAACASGADTAQVNWRLVDERKFSGREPIASCLPFYVIEAGEHGRRVAEKVITWHHYADEPPVDYHPDDEFLLDASRVFDRWVRISSQSPHTVKWEIVFQSVGGGYVVSVDADGVVISADGEAAGFSISTFEENTVVMERSGNELKVILNNRETRNIHLPRNDRAPLRLTARVRPVVIRRTKLFFGNDEVFSLPPQRATEAQPRWMHVYKEDFSDPKSIEMFGGYPPDAMLGRNNAALEMGPRHELGIEEGYAMLKMSLPGDMRISFRARSMLPGQPPFFGLMLALKGRLRKEDGYFVEWNYWQVQIKRRNSRVAGKQIHYPVGGSNGEWIRFRVERTGDTITMFTEDKEVLSWTDPHPLIDANHDLFAFYIWRVHMEFDDITIERNALDPVHPRPDHPVFPGNYLEDKREPAQSAADEFIF